MNGARWQRRALSLVKGSKDRGARLDRITTGRDRSPTAVRKAEAGSPGVKTPSQVAAEPRAVFLRCVAP